MSQNIFELIVQIERDAESNKLELPSLPEIIILIQEAVDNPDMGISEVARIIQLDPTLAARLLTIANSPLYGAKLNLFDVRQAIQLLGLAVAKDVVTTLVIHNIFNVSSMRLHTRIRNLWQHSCRVAAISQVMATVTPGLQPDRAMLAGLLHDIGVLPILVYADRFYGDENEAAKLDEVIEQLRGSLGQRILQQWQLGDDICVVPIEIDDWDRDHDGAATYSDIVQVAHVHSQFGLNDRQGTPPLSRMPAFNKLSLAKMGPHAGIELIEQAREEINVTIRLLNG